jgi:hypothetical protein
MSWRAGHGTGAGTPRIEVLPTDELPVGVQAPLQAEARGERTPDGRWTPGARTAQVQGGRAKRGKSRLAARLGLATLPEGDAFAPYRRAAATFRRVQCSELARTVGGGVCGPGPSSVVASAALALAWSRYFSDQAAATGDPELAMRSARLGETSRQHLLAAHELCAREAAARPKHGGGLPPWMRLVDGQAPTPPATARSAAPPIVAQPQTPSEGGTP